MGKQKRPAPPPCVLQVVPELDAGGAERTTVDVARALIAAGGKAVVAAAGGRLAAELRDAGASVVFIPAATKNPYEMLANVLRLRHIAEAHRADVIHARSRAPAWSALLAARGLKLPFVTTYHGIYNARTALKRRYNAVMAAGEVVIANSAMTARHVAQTHGVPPTRIVTIPRGTDMARFAPAAVPPPARRALRQSWGAGPETAVILLPARLTRWKGQEVFIDALALLEARPGLPHWHAVLAGDDQGRTGYREGLLARAEAAGVSDRLHLAGHVADMPAAYAAADLVVSPAIEPEAFGRVAVEAQAMMKPVIVADHGGARETVITAEEAARGGGADAGTDGMTGWRVKPGDPAALARAIIEALALTPAEREALGARARAFVEARFSVEAMTAATIDIYRRIARERPGAFGLRRGASQCAVGTAPRDSVAAEQEA